MSRGIGIYIGRKHVVGAAVVRSGNGFRLDAYAIEPIHESNDADIQKKSSPESNAIALVAQKIRAKGSFVRVGVSPFFIVTRYFIMPSLPEKEKDEAVRYEASRYTHMKLNESVFGYTESQHVPNVTSITANAAKRRLIQSTVMNLRRGSCEPEAVEPDYVPLARVSMSLGFGEFKKAHVMVWFDSDGSVNVTLASKGIVFLAQDFRLSADLERDREKMRDELHGSFRFLNENAGGAQVEYILVSGFGNLEDWEVFLAQAFPAVRTQVLRLPVKSDSEQPHSGALVLAYGLGLGELGMKSSLGEVSLLPPEDKKMRPRYFGAALAAAAGAVFGFFFLISIFIIGPLHHSLEQKKIRAEEPLAAFGTGSSESFEDVENRAFVLSTKRQALEKFEKSKMPLKEALVAAVQVLPPTMWMQRISLEPASRRRSGAGEQGGEAVTPRFIFEGYSYANDADKEAQQVNEWSQMLAKDPSFSNRFKNLAVDEIKQQKVAGRSTTRFTVTAEA